MMPAIRAALFGLIFSLMLASCQQSPLWFDSDYWYGEATALKEAKKDEEPAYIPLAAMPPRPDLLKWTPQDRETLIRELKDSSNLE